MIRHPLPVARIHACRLPEPAPVPVAKVELHVSVSELLAVVVPILCVLFALIIPALHGA